MSNTNWFSEAAKAPCAIMHERALAHQNSLTKPAGSLGTLEALAIRFAGFQRQLKPELNSIIVRVFAGDHGICAQNISSFPQIVTTQMVENFRSGGAAISVLCRELGADFSVVNMGTTHPLICDRDITNHIIANGTKDFSQEPAMTEHQCAQALAVGKQSVPNCDLFIGGEMGIGNTSSATAIFCALLNLNADNIAGPGTGLNDEGVAHKKHVIQAALNSHNINSSDPLAILRTFGGFEIAALSGAYIGAAQQGTPCLVDGFITTAAALIAIKLNPSIKPWLLFSHASGEPAHQNILQHVDAKPLLNLGMRLGEGSGAAVCIPLIKSALSLHANMATFSEAGVSQ